MNKLGFYFVCMAAMLLFIDGACAVSKCMPVGGWVDGADAGGANLRHLVDFDLNTPNGYVRGLGICSSTGLYSAFGCNGNGDYFEYVEQPTLPFLPHSDVEIGATYCWCRIISPFVTGWVFAGPAGGGNGLDGYGGDTVSMDEAGCMFSCSQRCMNIFAEPGSVYMYADMEALLFGGDGSILLN